MAEKLLPASRVDAAAHVVFTVVLILMGLAAAAWGLSAATPARTVLAAFCVLAIGALVPVLVTGCRSLRSPGLRLTQEGFEFSGFKIAWAHVERFNLIVDDEAGPTRIKVVFKPSAELSLLGHAGKIMGTVGVRIKPAYISLGEFKAEDGSLFDVLNNWLTRYRNRANR